MNCSDELAVRGDNVQLAVFTTGDESHPPVVMIHGYPDTHLVWERVVPLLADRFFVVTYDVRGAGDTGRPWIPDRTSAYRLHHLEADFRAVIDAVSPDRPVHLVGHDWGSVQGWHFVTSDALRGRIASFTSISGPCLDHVALAYRRQLRTPRRWLPLARQMMRSWYVAMFHVPFVAPLAWRTILGRRWSRVLERREGVPRHDSGVAPTIADDGARGVKLYRANIRPRLRRPTMRTTDVPVQLLIPDGDVFVTDAMLYGIEEFVPHLERHRLAGGHWVMRTDPAAVASAVSDFISRVR